MRTKYLRFQTSIFGFVLSLALLLSLMATFAHAETVEECVQNTITRGSESSKRKELANRCKNTSANQAECKEAAKLVKQAIEEHRATVRATCEKQAKNGAAGVTGQDSSQKATSAMANDAKQFTDASAIQLDRTNRIATKGKNESEQAINKVIDNPEKVSDNVRPDIQDILKTFKDSDYSDVSTAASYAQAMHRIDLAWKKLQAHPDMAQDKSADAYEATATYLNAEEVRLGTAYQKNQMATASTSLQAKSTVTDGNSKSFGEDKDGNGNSFLNNAGKSMGLIGSAAGAVGALATLSKLSSGKGGENSMISGGVAAPAAVSAGSTALATGGAEANGLGASKGIVAQADGAASKLSGTDHEFGSTAPYSGGEGSGISSGASKSDTSLRDSLRKKLAESEHGGTDAPGGDLAASDDKKDPKARQAAVNEARMAQVLAPEANVVPGFVMTGSETDAAVKDLLAGFEDKDKEKADGAAGGVPGFATGEEGRQLASLQSAPPGVEGRDSINLFSRVRAKVLRCVKKGYITNGITNTRI